MRSRSILAHPSWRTLRVIQDKYTLVTVLEHRTPASEQIDIGSGDNILELSKDTTKQFSPFSLQIYVE